MMFVRGDHLRGVDVHDQLRACKWKMQLISRKKAWPTLTGGLFEMCVVNIFIVKRQHTSYKSRSSPGEFRWDMVHGMVEKAKQLEEAPDTCEELESDRVTSTGDEAVVPRFEGAETHHCR